MNLHKFIQRICAATVASALTLSLCTPVLAEGTAALPAAETGGIPIDSTHFPDDNFIAYVELGCDKDHDGTLSQAELNRVTELYVDHANIKDLTGIELFPNLDKLDCKYNNLTRLDVSKNTKLTKLYCESNQLTGLDLSKNTALTELDCALNQLTGLDLSKNTALTELDCALNQLTGLDLSKNTKLTELDCSDNQLANLDVSENPELTYLKCVSNQLTRLDLHVNTALETLICDNNQLTSLNLSSNTALTQVYCSGNKRQITVGETGQFDLSALKGFDADRAVWPEGVTVENGILTVPYNTTSLTYRYDVRGNGADDDYKEFVLTFDEVKEPDLPDDSSAPADTGSTAGGAIAAVAVGGAAVWGGYELVTRVMLHSLLPEGAAIPASRGQLALLVWNTAGRPEPVNAPAFADVTDPDTARAAQWCVEQGLLTLKKDGSFDPDGWTPKFRVIQVWNKAFPKQ
ncbi:MAG: leucine-rich repeat domain-containing protein [Faecalibacterium sp.]